MKKYLKEFQTFGVYVVIIILLVLSIDVFVNTSKKILGDSYSWVGYVIVTILAYAVFEVLVQRRKKDNSEFLGIEIPENLKDLFIDSLRAFENYSKLSGYEVKFSFDNAGKDRLGFKFTVTENPNNLSNDEIRADIQDFLNKLQKGEKFDDLPVLINPLEHQIILSSLKARLSLIEHNLTLEKDLRTLYQSKLKELLEIKNLFSSNPMTVNNNYLHSGGENNSKQIEATNSNVNIGDGNFIEDNSINIEHSFNEKKTIVEKIEYSIQQIDKEDSLSDKDKLDLKRHLENIKEEITDEAQPDASKLKKSWDKIKKIAEGTIFSYDLTQALQWISEQFGFAIDFSK